MPITPEQSQQITNLQQRILRNVAAGKPSSDGIDQSELRAALDILRGDRAKALAAGATKPGRKATPKKTAVSSESLEARLKAKGFNLD